ncbi:MAG: class I SAM-dependent methyltransferase [Promethearchaeota archaeon]
MEIPNIDDFRKVFLKYTKMAFKLLPDIDKPRILDVGCGTGVSTIELANLSEGEVIGLDIDQLALERFKEKIKNFGFESRVKIVNTSFFNNNFSDESVDIIWAEGIFHIIGYDKSFKESYRLLKENGFLVMVDTLNRIESKFSGIKGRLDYLENLGFNLYNQVNWKKSAWWIEYYQPLEKKLKELRDSKIDAILYQDLIKHENEISMVRQNPKKFDCAHYILQKIKKK